MKHKKVMSSNDFILLLITVFLDIVHIFYLVSFNNHKIIVIRKLSPTP